MRDMLVKLYDIPDGAEWSVKLPEGVQIRRAMAPDKLRIVEWVREHSVNSAAEECDVCFSRRPVSCFIATRGKDIIGYACYEATALNFFGPTSVLDAEQGKGIGKALLLHSLTSMKQMGYGYAIIGGVGPEKFYEKCVGAVLIEGSSPGVYKDFLGRMR